ncbi:MAG: hypothetical protein AMJ53_18310 [Gammaproteobacteria bacterium SG8_11]|nr:MAG: hypothetical protein AMJ53_18310 [Gammaproteobacteria bacterium SG8_11]
MGAFVRLFHHGTPAQSDSELVTSGKFMAHAKFLGQMRGCRCLSLVQLRKRALFYLETGINTGKYAAFFVG